ncbi:MAG: leucyl aminopeptidase [Pseudomonadota bacterium]|nr:leucyl aminopeptidase [Pseudomonadota bacterium]
MKFKIQKTTLEITLQDKQLATKELAAARVVFSFCHELLNNAKLYVADKLDYLDDLTEVGTIIKYPSKTDSKHNIVVSLGEKNKFNLKKYYTSLNSLAKYLSKHKKIDSIDIILEPEIGKLVYADTIYSAYANYNFYVEQSIFQMLNGMYYFDQLKSKQNILGLKKINFVNSATAKSTPSTAKAGSAITKHSASDEPSKNKQPLANAIALLNGIYLVKNLGNLPANIATPTYLAKTAQDMAKLSKKVEVKILAKKELEEIGMHSFLAVAQGSKQEPKFITLKYLGGKSKDKPIILVGKGVTFDSGGISIKPSAKMDEMKYDMLGAATTLGIFRSVVELNLPINLIVAAPCTENLPSGSAVKPGDIITTLSGKTIEILNTDAEGRLILADALTYIERFNPKLVIDMATLTGACVIALGSVASALYCNDSTLCDEIKSSAQQSTDTVWEMPLFDDYEKGLKNSIADLSNISSSNTGGGSIVAAKFLQNFINYKWAHLDIAGTAYVPGSYDGTHASSGATGRPFTLLMDFLRNQANKKN